MESSRVISDKWLSCCWFFCCMVFYTQSDAYDVIHIPEEKEMLMNHALSAYKEDAPRRIAIVDNGFSHRCRCWLPWH